LGENTDDDLETPNQPAAPQEHILDDDGESDDEFPAPIPGEKGLKVENIHTLKHGGGFVNYRLWLQNLLSAFRADRTRFHNAENRIIKATNHMDEQLLAIWSSDIELMPHLQSHWRKFLRWAEQTHFHGEVDRAQHVQEFNDAAQRENEDPNSFYSRLSILAIGIGRKLTTDDLFPKLLPSVRNVILRNGRGSKNVRDLVATAQQIWGTFNHTTKRKRSATDHDDRQVQRPNTYPHHQRGNYRGNATRGSRGNHRGNGHGANHPQHRNHSSNTLTEPERTRRTENQLCFNCGLPNHLSRTCTKPFNPNPAASTFPSPNNNAANNTTSLPPQTASLRHRNTTTYRRNPNTYQRGFHRNQTTRAQPLTSTEDRVQSLGSDDDDDFDAEDRPSASKYSKN
jgi:hypothetical protein